MGAKGIGYAIFMITNHNAKWVKYQNINI